MKRLISLLALTFCVAGAYAQGNNPKNWTVQDTPGGGYFLWCIHPTEIPGNYKCRIDSTFVSIIGSETKFESVLGFEIVVEGEVDVIGVTELNDSNAPSDEECLTYEAQGDLFEWQACGGGGGGSIAAKEANVLVTSSATTFDFFSGFGVTEAPSGEVNISVDMAQLSHASQHGDGASDEVIVTSGMMNADFGDYTCTGSPQGCQLDANVVTTAQIAIGTIEASDIGTDAITTTHIGTDQVGPDELSSSAIQSGDIEAGDLPADGYATTYINDDGDTYLGDHDMSGADVTIPSGTSYTCTRAGQVFYDSDQPSGQRLYVCEAASGSPTLQGDGGGGGGGDNVSIDGVAAADPDFTSDGDLDAIRCTGAGTPDASCVSAEDVIYRHNTASVDSIHISAGVVDSSHVENGSLTTADMAFNPVEESELNTFAELQALVANKTLVNEEDAWTFDNNIRISGGQLTVDCTEVSASAGALTPNWDANTCYEIDLDANLTINNSTTELEDGWYTLVFVQDVTGSRTVTRGNIPGDFPDSLVVNPAAQTQSVVQVYSDDGTGFSQQYSTFVLDLPALADCSTVTDEGQMCWESDADNLWVGDGTTAQQMNAAAAGDEVQINGTAITSDPVNFADSTGAGGITVVGTFAGNPDVARFGVSADAIDGTHLAGTINVPDGNLIDFGTNVTAATEGLFVPANATDCSVATGEGQICWEEDADNLWVGTGTDAYALDAFHTECIYIEDPVAADDLNSIKRNSTAVPWTLTEIWAESDQTVNFNLQIDDGTPANVNGADISPAAGEAEDTSLEGDTVLDVDEELDLVVSSVSGTPTWVSICWTYRKGT